MMVKKMMGVMPELDPVHMMASMVSQKMGIEENIAIGWIMHFVIGSIAWGAGFAISNKIIPPSGQVQKGILFGIAAWLLMMIGPMPMSGAGLFGMNIGMMAPVMTFVFHLIFGATLGAVFLKIGGPQEG